MKNDKNKPVSKDLNYFKNLDYEIVIEKQHDDGQTWYMAYARELGKYSCYGIGDTPQQALENFLREKDEFITFLYNSGQQIPEPQQNKTKEYSGIFNVRTSPGIHAKLVEQAKSQNISLNLYLNQIISSAVEKQQFSSQVLSKLQEIEHFLHKHHQEVTFQLQYKKRKLPDKQIWNKKYSDEHYAVTS